MESNIVHTLIDGKYFYRGIIHEISVRLSNAWIVIKRKQFLTECLYRIKGTFVYFSYRKMVGRGQPINSGLRNLMWRKLKKVERWLYRMVWN